MDHDEHGTDDGQHPPRWVPYTPPPPDGWDRLRFWLRRLSFPFVIVLLVAGVVGVFYWSEQAEAEKDASATVDVLPSTIGLGEGAEASGPAGPAPLRVRTIPSGATVRVNGDSVGVTPFTDSTRRAGVYMLSAQRQGFFRADTVLVLEEGPLTTVRLSLRQRPDYTGSVEETPPDRPPVSIPSEQPSAERPLPVTSVPKPAARPPATPDPVFGGLYVTSAPPGAVVAVEGTDRGRTPLPVSQVPPGPQEVSVRLDGYEPWTARVDVLADSTARVHAALDPRTGQLRVLARPWGTVYVNETLHAREADVWYETSLPEGRHEVTVVHPALGRQTRQVDIRAGETTEIVINLQEKAESSP
jgi:hypothetical protein